MIKMKKLLIFLTFHIGCIFAATISADQQLQLAKILGNNVGFEKEYNILLNAARGEIPEDATLDVVRKFFYNIS